MKSEGFVGVLLTALVGVVAVLSLVIGRDAVVSSSTTGASTPVTVDSASSQALLTALETCETSGTSGCGLEWAKNILESTSPNAAVKLVASSTSPTLQRSCHSVMHDLGRLSSNGKPLSEVQALIKTGDAFCQFGFQHGVLIGVSDSVSNDQEFTSIMAQACDAFPRTGNTYSSCVHGIGHAASSRYPDDLNKAGALCASLGSNVGWCSSGAVMEWGGSSVEALKRSAGGTAKAVATCASFRTVTGDAGYVECFREMPAILFAGQVSRTDIADWCANRDEDSVKESCAVGLGLTFGTELTVTADMVSNACGAVGSAEYVGHCAATAGGAYYQRDVVRNKDVAKAICAALSTAERTACDKYLAKLVSSIEATITSLD